MSMHHSNPFPQQNVSNNWQCGEYCGQDVLIINRLYRKIVNLQRNKNVYASTKIQQQKYTTYCIRKEQADENINDILTIKNATAEWQFLSLAQNHSPLWTICHDLCINLLHKWKICAKCVCSSSRWADVTILVCPPLTNHKTTKFGTITMHLGFYGLNEWIYI